MSKDLNISLLMDFYGEMLTEKQRDVLDLYYNQDFSLSEIAIDLEISRQGVRDTIKRGEHQLTELEERLGLARKFSDLSEKLGEISCLAETLDDGSADAALGRIKVICAELLDAF